MKLPFLEGIEKRAKSNKDKFGVRQSAYPILFGGLVIFVFAALFVPSGVATAVSGALWLAPLWLPVLLVWAAWLLWVTLKRSEFIAKQDTILLEVRPPRNITKTPLAMETVLAGMHHAPGESTWWKKYFKGAVRPWWSLEIASFEGKVHFFIWTRASFRRIVEAQIYAQYPGAQVIEAPDYSRTISATPEEWELWGCEFKHTKEDPYPIKTYVEYGLDKVQKEPEQVDPLANLIEFMGSMGNGEYLWLQFVVRVHKGEKYNKLNKAGKTYTWKDQAEEIIEEMRKKMREPYKDASGAEVPGFPNPTRGEADKIAAIERNIAKLPFDVGARGVYIARPDRFDPIVIAGLTGIFKQFSSEGWNGFAPTNGLTVFDDYPWEIGVDKLKTATKKGVIDAYRRRQFFHQPYQQDSVMVMSTEELATLFHVPSRAVETPSLGRINSATAEPPSNLPT